VQAERSKLKKLRGVGFRIFRLTLEGIVQLLLLGFRRDGSSDIDGRNCLLFGKLIDVYKPLFLVVVTSGLIELIASSFNLLCNLSLLSPTKVEREKRKLDILSYL